MHIFAESFNFKFFYLPSMEVVITGNWRMDNNQHTVFRLKKMDLFFRRNYRYYTENLIKSLLKRVSKPKIVSM